MRLSALPLWLFVLCQGLALSIGFIALDADPTIAASLTPAQENRIHASAASDSGEDREDTEDSGDDSEAGSGGTELSTVNAEGTDLNLIDVYLITIGRGDQLESLFGHSLLRVVDRGRNQEFNFNWGIFDFEDPNFVWNFYRGDLDYRLVLSDFAPLVQYYKNVEHRSVRQSHLHLSLKQKARLVQSLAVNLQPQNAHYQYLQFKDNCSTRPRDHLDRALQGKIKAAFSPLPARETFRSIVRRDSAPVAWASLGLDFISNSELDHKISQWELMFLPSSLHHLLASLPAFDDDGREIPHQALIDKEELLSDAPDPEVGLNPYGWWYLCFGSPMLLLMILSLRNSLRPAIWKSLFGPSDVPGVCPTRRAFAWASMLCGTVSGILGTVLATNWLLSHYAELAHNAALFLVWPTDWLFAIYGLTLLTGAFGPQVRASLGRLVSRLALLHLLSAGLLVVLRLLHGTEQDVFLLLALTGLITVLYDGLAILFVRSEARGAHAQGLPRSR